MIVGFKIFSILYAKNGNLILFSKIINGAA